MGVIYKITNTANGLCYIGQTTATLDRRWNEHQADARNRKSHPFMHRAMLKYGYDAFTIEVVDSADTRAELDQKEVEWIAKLGTADKQFGYNCTTGGGSCKHGPNSRARQKGISHWTPESKAKRIETLRRLGKLKLSPERKEALRQAKIAWKATPEARANMRAGQIKFQEGRTAEQRAEVNARLLAAQARKREANGGILPAASEAMKKAWKRRKEEGDSAFFARRAEATKKYWQQPEVRARESSKWTLEMKEKNRIDYFNFFHSFRGVMMLVNKKRNWRAKNGVSMKPARLLMAVANG